MIAEFLGTALLITIGDGVVAAVVLMGKTPDRMAITTAWGLAVALAVFLSGRLSGGHLNPAVTLALAARGEFPAARVLPYWTAQLAGRVRRGDPRLCGLRRGVPGVRGGARPRPGGDEFRGHAHRPGGRRCRGVRDLPGVRRHLAERLQRGPRHGGPADGRPGLDRPQERRTRRIRRAPGAGALVWAIGLSLGAPTGYAINPARDFGPRVASALLGWGPSVFLSHGYYFWIPIVGPLVGGLLGTYLYDFAIHRYLPPKDAPSPPGELSP